MTGFLHTVKLIGDVPAIWDRVYNYAWFVTFAIAFVVYGVLMIGNRSARADRTEKT